jgi:murein endopeptidase
MVTPFDGGDDYMIMYNAKYNIKKFTLVGGLMTGDMAMPGMMSGMHSSSHTMRMDSEPYFGIEFKPFKNRKLKVYYNHSDMMKSVGIMMPILNIGKMKMNHMNHMDHDHNND